MDNKVISDHKGIKDAFVKYYADLYKGKIADLENAKKYLGQFKLANIANKLKQDLNKEVTIEVITEVINTMKRNKTSGPDGFTAIFYKKLKEELCPVMKNLIEAIVQDKKMPRTWSEAILL